MHFFIKNPEIVLNKNGVNEAINETNAIS